MKYCSNSHAFLPSEEHSLIKLEYVEYMLQAFPQTPEKQWLKCVEFCGQMKMRFPELEIKRGVVWSEDNIDNPHVKYPRQYDHAWLTDSKGSIIDPTVRQFDAIGKLIYKEFKDIPHGKCMGCGMYHWVPGSLYCGECEWSKERGGVNP